MELSGDDGLRRVGRSRDRGASIHHKTITLRDMDAKGRRESRVYRHSALQLSHALRILESIASCLVSASMGKDQCAGGTTKRLQSAVFTVACVSVLSI